MSCRGRMPTWSLCWTHSPQAGPRPHARCRGWRGRSDRDQPPTGDAPRIAQAIVELTRQTRALGVDVAVLPPSRALAMVGALVELMHATIPDHGPEHLPRLRRELSTIVAMLVSEPPTP